MPMKMITEKRISDKVVLIRIPDVTKLYIKGKFLLDILTNWFIIIVMFEKTAILT